MGYRLLAVLAAVAGLSSVAYTQDSAVAGPVWVVNSTSTVTDGSCDPLGGAGAECSLGDAIAEALDGESIHFNIPMTDAGCNAGTGVCTITAPPTYQIVVGDMTIDGYTQPGASPNTLATGNDAQLKIQIDKVDAVGSDAIKALAGGAEISGLVISNIGNNSAGIYANGEVTVTGNWIGNSRSRCARRTPWPAISSSQSGRLWTRRRRPDRYCQAPQRHSKG